MKKAAIIFLILAVVITIPFSIRHLSKISIHNFVANDMRGNEVKFDDYKGKVLLIVNTATKCGFTPQFFQLQTLYKDYKDSGFEIIAFPSNSFNQEPLSTKDVITYCSDNFLVDFPIFEKIDVKGPFQASIYKFLTEEKSNPDFHGEITWNFEKFLIGKNGKVISRFTPKTTPDDPAIIAAIEEALGQ